jgi:nucleoside-diphosphate-sugar epimerase
VQRKVLILGGAGFIGSHLCDFFIANDFEVICLDNFATASPDNIRHLSKLKKFKFMDADVIEPITIKGRLDFILHFAALAGPNLFRTRPLETARTGVMGTLNALELARVKQARFVLASSDAVYGEPATDSQKESYNGNVDPVAQRSVYDEAKRFAETLTMAYHRTYKVNTAIARIFQTYGTRMPKDGRVIPAFIDCAMNGIPIIIYGSGKQTRSFCHIADMVEGIYKLALSSIHEPVNLGSPQETSILDLARLIADISASTASIEFREALVEDRSIRKPDITLAKCRLKWEPRIWLSDGLRLVINDLTAMDRQNEYKA